MSEFRKVLNELGDEVLEIGVENNSDDGVRILIPGGANKEMAKWITEIFRDIVQESSEARAKVEELDEEMDESRNVLKNLEEYVPQSKPSKWELLEHYHNREPRLFKQLDGFGGGEVYDSYSYDLMSGLYEVRVMIPNGAIKEEVIKLLELILNIVRDTPQSELAVQEPEEPEEPEFEPPF